MRCIVEAEGGIGGTDGDLSTSAVGDDTNADEETAFLIKEDSAGV